MDFEDLLIYAAEVVGLLLVLVVPISLTPIGRALADRVRGRRRDDPDLRPIVERCVDEITQLEDVVGEMHERLDAMERHVAQLPPPRPPSSA